MSPTSWDLAPPPPSDLGDRDVPLLGQHLVGRRIALLVTGGIAAMKAPLLARALRKEGADVVAFASREALRYVAEDALHWSTRQPVVTQLSPLAEHLSDDSPFDAFLVAPASYNTINKLAAGIADTVVTAPLAGALGRMEQGRCAVLVAPTMHGSMHNRILTTSLQRLDELGVRLIPPRPGYGKHNIPHEDALVAEVVRALSASRLRGQEVAVLGPTTAPDPHLGHQVPLQRAELGNAIARELWMRGADVTLVGSPGAPPPRPPLQAEAFAPGTFPLTRLLVTWTPLEPAPPVGQVFVLRDVPPEGTPESQAAALVDRIEAAVV